MMVLLVSIGFIPNVASVIKHSHFGEIIGSVYNISPLAQIQQLKVVQAAASKNPNMGRGKEKKKQPPRTREFLLVLYVYIGVTVCE